MNDVITTKEGHEVPIVPVHTVSATPFKTHYNRDRFPNDNEINSLPSKTVPDQSLSVAELVYRFTYGQSLGGSRVPVYEDEDNIVPANWDKLDLSEKHDFIRERQEELQEMTDKYEQLRAQEAKRQRDADIEAEVERKLKARSESRQRGSSNQDLTPEPKERTQAELPL